MYTYNNVMELRKQEGLQEGLKRGLQKGLQEGLLIGQVKGQIKSLMNEFLACGHLSSWSIDALKREKILFPMDLVQEVWEHQEELLGKNEAIFGNKSANDFIGLLKRADILKG